MGDVKASGRPLHGVRILPLGRPFRASADRARVVDAGRGRPQVHICPLYVVHETRVAECDSATNKCVMIQPTDIRCDGFTARPHSCPTGSSANAIACPTSRARA